MATNTYFTQGTTGEQNLVGDLVKEQIKMFGQDVYYIPRVIVDQDPTFDEDSLSKFEDAYITVSYTHLRAHETPEHRVWGGLV